MSPSPPHHSSRLRSRPAAVAKPAAGSRDQRRRTGRTLLMLVIWVCVGLALGNVAAAILPSLYTAEARILLPAATMTDDQPKAIETPQVAAAVIAELRLAERPDALPPAWWRPDLWAPVYGWIDKSVVKLPPLPTGLEDQLWQHVELTRFGHSSRVLAIQVTLPDAALAAAVANAIAKYQTTGGTLLSAALTPAEPSFPPQQLIVLAGAMIGLCFGVLRRGGSASKNFRGEDDIELTTGLPVLARVPRLADGKTALAHVLRDPMSPYTESLRRLHARLQSSDWKEVPKTIAICSAAPGDGRSVLAASLGRLLAGEGKRVLLVDCDWRHPDMHRLFRLPNDLGLTNLLVDKRKALDDLIQTDALSGLDIITAGRRSKTAQRAMLTPRMREILDDLAKCYDLVLLDFPPVQSAQEVLLLSRQVDRVVQIVRWRHSKRRAVLDSIENILSADGQVSGIVFTQTDPESPGN